MKASVSFPSDESLEAFLNTRRDLLPSYPEQMDTLSDFAHKRLSSLRKKYDYDDNRVLLGQGERIFEQAKTAIRQWKMFPEGWTKVYPSHAPIHVGRQVAVLIRVLGLWWWNSSEIRYTIDEVHRFGFAYGTLPGHVESGEELFLVEMDDEGQVWYRIKAFSRPAYRIIAMVYPYARSRQKRFVRESLEQMKGCMKKTIDDPVHG